MTDLILRDKSVQWKRVISMEIAADVYKKNFILHSLIIGYNCHHSS